jgi:hypothetical protein
MPEQRRRVKSRVPVGEVSARPRFEAGDPALDLGGIECPNTEHLRGAGDLGRANLRRANADAEPLGYLAAAIPCCFAHCQISALHCYLCA